MSTARDLLISQLSRIPSLNGRYKNIRCINYPPKPGEEKRGFFSLVFSAEDPITGEVVALKFMDPGGTSDSYRLDCFEREPQILQRLVGKSRCLQLVENLQKFKFEIETTAGDKFPMSFDFFSTDWLSDDIDNYFLAKEDLAPIDKLITFRQIVLAVEAIHNSTIFHRDIKPDNIRVEKKLSVNTAYLIDFGTAAQFESKKLRRDYESFPVGANLYSAPEAFLGFSGERDIAKFTDFYALGCMLYELFNKHIYFNELENRNPNFRKILTALGIQFSRYPKINDRLEAWDEIIDKFTKALSPPSYLGSGCSIPNGIADLINGLFNELTIFDFRKRLSNFNKIRNTIDSAITVLNNDDLYRKSLEKRKLFRENKIRKIKEKEAQLALHLNRRDRVKC